MLFSLEEVWKTALCVRFPVSEEVREPRGCVEGWAQALPEVWLCLCRKMASDSFFQVDLLLSGICSSLSSLLPSGWKSMQEAKPLEGQSLSTVRGCVGRGSKQQFMKRFCFLSFGDECVVCFFFFSHGLLKNSFLPLFLLPPLSACPIFLFHFSSLPLQKGWLS